MTPRRTRTDRKAPAKKAGPLPSLGSFMASEIVLRDPNEIKPFPNNPKIHTPAQLDAIEANIRAFGFDQPALIDEFDQTLKGHGRRLVCARMGIMLPTIVREGLSDADKWAIVISDNALPAMTGFDQQLLRIGLTQLAKVDYPLHLTGFNNVSLATFIGGNNPAGAQPNEVPDLVPGISKHGDVWLMGDHRLICGDCTNVKIRAKLLGDDEPTVMLTDPPYNTATEGGDFYKRGNSKKIGAAELGDFTVDALCDLLETNIIFTSKELVPDYLNLAIEEKLTWDLAVLHRSAAVPNHNNHLTTDLDYIIMMGKIAPKAGLDHADYSKLFSVGSWERPVPWAKPVELIERLLRLYTVAGDLVLEPYCGSGTTIIACEKLARVCLAVELNAAYADLSVRRWQKFANKTATLQGTRKTFDQIEKERSRKAA